MAVETSTPAQPALISRKLRIEFLFLDLTTCTRCLGTARSLASALEVARETLEAAGVEVELDKVLVASEEQAPALRFVSSPTIRVDGHDLALELRESSCGSGGLHRRLRRSDRLPRLGLPRPRVHRAAGGDDRGRDPETRLRPPAPAARQSPEAYALPENLARVFAGKAAQRRAAVSRPSRRRAARPRPRRTAAAPTIRRDAGAGERPARCRRAARRRADMAMSCGPAGLHRPQLRTATPSKTSCRRPCSASTTTPTSSSTSRRCAHGCSRSLGTPSPITTGARRFDANSPWASTSPARAAVAERARSGRTEKRARGLPRPTAAAARSALPRGARPD